MIVELDILRTLLRNFFGNIVITLKMILYVGMINKK